MAKDPSRLFSRQSVYGVVRREAFAILRGPSSVEVKDEFGEVSFWGWPTLSLEVRVGRPVRIESRLVYANLLDDSQDTVVLRAATWNAGATLQGMQDHGPNYRLALPARFVQLPTGELRAWLAEFDTVTVAIKGTPQDDDDIPIRRIRIEYDYFACIFEKVWQIRDADSARLNQTWELIWDRLTQQLLTAPAIANVDEYFSPLNHDIHYDLQSYQPDQK